MKEPGRVFLEVTTTRSPTEFDAIKKEKPNKVKCDADEIEIFSQQDGKWIGEEKMSASLRDMSEPGAWCFVLSSFCNASVQIDVIVYNFLMYFCSFAR